jgi:thioesterase domain-containing protein
MSEMADPNTSGFKHVHDDAERLYDMQREQAAQTFNLLTSQTEILNKLVTDVAVIKMQTDGFEKLTERVVKLEGWKAFVAGIAAASTIIGGAIGWGIALIVKH